jgi:hypothetical protein
MRQGIDAEIVRRDLATFVVLPCCYGSGTRNISTTNMAANFSNLGLSSLHRRPVLTALMVYFVGFAVVAFAVWRGASSNPNPRKCEEQYLVQSSADIVGRSDTRALRTDDENGRVWSI